MKVISAKPATGFTRTLRIFSVRQILILTFQSQFLAEVPFSMTKFTHPFLRARRTCRDSFVDT